MIVAEVRRRFIALNDERRKHKNEEEEEQEETGAKLGRKGKYREPASAAKTLRSLRHRG